MDDSTNRRAVRTRSRRYALGRTLAVINVVLLLTVALAMRVWELGHLPGINGDEAEYGVRAVRFLRGEPIVWRTPTGNLVNPFFFFPQVAVHAVASPSFAVLRLVAVASGLTALALNYLLCRRLFDGRTALVSTLLLAVLPIAIAYSRFSWDTCQTLAVSTLVVYPALLALAEPHHRGRWLALAIFGYAAAYLVHPTNVFLGGFLAAAILVERRAALLRAVGHRSRWFWAGLVAMLLALGATGSWAAREVFSIGVIGAAQPAAIGEFVRNYGRLFNGLTIYRYIAGSHGAETIVGERWPFDFGLADAAALVAVVGAVLIVGRQASRRGNPADWGLLVGWAATTAGFLLVAGPEAIRPHWERYGLCLVLPGAILLSRAAGVMMSRRAPFGRAAAVAFSALAWLLLADFAAGYFGFIHQTGGRSQDTFRTAAVEPKQAAFDLIALNGRSDEPADVVAPSWWNYWPLAYLAAGRANVTLQPVDAATHGRDAWFVEYAGSRDHLRRRRELVDARTAYREWTVWDYAGRPVLVVFEPR